MYKWIDTRKTLGTVHALIVYVDLIQRAGKMLAAASKPEHAMPSPPFRNTERKRILRTFLPQRRSDIQYSSGLDSRCFGFLCGRSRPGVVSDRLRANGNSFTVARKFRGGRCAPNLEDR